MNLEISRKSKLEEIMIRLGEINRYFATSRDEFLARFELSRPQAELLFAIRHNKMTITELAKAFAITPSAVSQMVSQLESKELAERKQDKTDRRIIYVELSRDARAYFTKMRRAFVSHLETKFAGLSDSEIVQLEKILTKTTKALGKESLWRD